MWTEAGRREAELRLERMRTFLADLAQEIHGVSDLVLSKGDHSLHRPLNGVKTTHSNVSS